MLRARRNRSASGKSVEALRYKADTRTNIPTAEYQSMVEEDTKSPLRAAYQRRNCERWITIDTSRVALALVRARIMGARYPNYILADSRDGQLK